MRRHTWDSWTMFDNADGSGIKANLAQANRLRSLATHFPPKGRDHGTSERLAFDGLDRAMDPSSVRIALIRDAIAGGRYVVPSASVAQKFMDAMQRKVH